MPKELKLSLTERTEDGINVFSFAGSLGVEGATGVAGLFQACLSEKVYKIIVDLEGVKFISSAGMGAFLSVVGELRSHSGDLVLVKMDAKIARVFRSLDVLDYFTTAPDIKSAKARLRGAPAPALAEPESKPIRVRVEPERQTNVFRNFLSVLAAYSDILEGRAPISDKLHQALEITASYLSISDIAIVNLSDGFFIPETSVGIKPPGMPTTARQQLAESLAGVSSEFPGNLRGLRADAKSWLKAVGARLLFPLSANGEVFSVIVIGPKRTTEDISPEERRVLRYLRSIINLLCENVHLEKKAVKADEAKKISEDKDRLEKKLIETETLYMVSRELAADVDMKKILPVLLVIFVGQMGTDKAVILLKDESGVFKVAAARGINEKKADGMVLSPSPGLVKELTEEKAPIAIELLGVLEDSEEARAVRPLVDAGIALLTPIIFKDRLIGVAGLGPKVSKVPYNDDELRLLTALVNLASISIENARLFRKITETYSGVVRALVNAIDARDKYTRGHTERVTRYVGAFGRWLGFDEDDLQTLVLGAILHDIGYVGVDEKALLEPDGLTDETRAEIQKHPFVGYQILKELKFIGESLDIVKHHHERWDGTGYPDGLSGDDIPFGARVVALCDALDAMTSDRRYRKGKDLEEVITEITANSGTQFDPALASDFTGLLADGTIKIIPQKP